MKETTGPHPHLQRFRHTHCYEGDQSKDMYKEKKKSEEVTASGKKTDDCETMKDSEVVILLKKK